MLSLALGWNNLKQPSKLVTACLDSSSMEKAPGTLGESKLHRSHHRPGSSKGQQHPVVHQQENHQIKGRDYSTPLSIC